MANTIALLEDILACKACEPELACGANPVLQIDSRAKILIAGQAPGIRVHETGIPFNDPSGDRLRTWLQVSRDQFYDPSIFAIVPMAFCYPGTGKSGDLPPPKLCAELWRQKVLNSLPNIEQTLAIGSYAQKYHFPSHKGSLTSLLQSYLVESDSGLVNDLERELGFETCVPLPHPSPRNNVWLKKNPWFEQDFLPKLRRRMPTTG